MAKRENYVGWDAMRHIWWAFAWRYSLGFIIQYLIADSESVLVYLFGIFIDWWVWQWAIRESLMDKYPSFALTAENKKTGLSIYNARGRLGFWIALRVWWAFSWRLSLVSVAIFVGCVLAALIGNRSVWDAGVDYFAPATDYFTNAVMFLLSPWALHESLADRYWGFRFTAKPRGPDALQ